MLQERLQLMFHDRTITSLHEKYLQEQIDCDMGDLEELTTPAPLISLIDKQVSLRSHTNNTRHSRGRGCQLRESYSALKDTFTLKFKLKFIINSSVQGSIETNFIKPNFIKL